MKSIKYINKIANLAAAAALVCAMGFTGMASAVEDGVCGPMDVVFVIDDTGSMGSAIANVQAGAAVILADVVTASGGDYQSGVVTFKDLVTTHVDLAPLNQAATGAALAAIFASGGGGEPEASDEALRAVINGADTCVPPAAFSNGNFRAGAVKIAVMMTDARPGGCDDFYTAGVDDNNAHARALEASAAGIKISAIYNETFTIFSTTIIPIMNDYAATTGGVYVQTPADGSGTATAIQEIIAACGSSANECPLSQGFWKNHEDAWPVDGFEIGGTNYTKEELLGVLNAPVRGNAVLILAKQLIAARLNIANGSDPDPISDALTDADSLLTGVDITSDKERPRTSTGHDMTATAGVLEEYNTRLLTPDCEETGEDG